MAAVAGLGRLVGLAQELKAVHRIEPVPRSLPEGQATPGSDRIDHAQRDDVLQAEQLAHDRGALCPRTGQGDVQVVAASFGRISAGAVGRDPALERIRGPGELRLLVLLVLLLPGPQPAAVVAVSLEVHRARAACPASQVSGRSHVASRTQLSLRPDSYQTRPVINAESRPSRAPVAAALTGTTTTAASAGEGRGGGGGEHLPDLRTQYVSGLPDIQSAGRRRSALP